MSDHNVVLSTEPEGGKGGIATVVPIHMEALNLIGSTQLIPTHRGGGAIGKILPWVASFFKIIAVLFVRRKDRITFHIHPGSGFCIIRMLLLALYLRFVLVQRTVVYVHTPYLEQYLQNTTWRFLLLTLIRCGHRSVALTEFAKELIERESSVKNLEVVPNPYRIPKQPPRKKIRDEGRVTILSLGRLVDGKGFAETVKAMKYLPPNYRLVIGGEGPLGVSLGKLIADEGLSERVDMEGWVSGDAKEELLRNSHVFCLPSQIDSFGMSFVEAQVYELPIVAFAHPPVMEVVHQPGGVFVRSSDPQEIAHAILRANELNYQSRPDAGRKWVDSTFGVEIIAKKIGRLIEHCHS
ncbi:glycosyltransferase family 4 protein [Paraburkholderia aromaticivorans]|uniref:glycosyltransferase family 4 protein n=1 Tax=Paraburkholderia aromaticivorans TaxID=2026199 RepID=UPI001455F23F|nr:glycosyltransferase family 4 protein [Paraburkholderia aromaticivorans]